MTQSMQARVPVNETEHVDIHGTPIKASRVALDTWGMGVWRKGGSYISECIATVHAALDQGINLIDTAPLYGFGRAERILGLALEGVRSRTVIATKTGLEWRGGTVYRNATPARIVQEVDDSLRRLRTDYIDIYQVHWPDPLVPIEDTAEAMRLLYQQGKIRAIGVSNFSVAQMELFRRVAPLHVVRPHYNVFERGVEEEILPYCEARGIVTLGYGALCRGLLSGRLPPDATFNGDDLRRNDPKFQPVRFAHYLNAVRQLDELAQLHFNRRVIHLAVRWLLDQGISVALWGGCHPKQVKAALGVPGWSLTNAYRSLIARIVNVAVIDPVDLERGAPLLRAGNRLGTS